ncbi:SMP-30/gluconolactonase/LRE family protein [Ensifer sp. ENS06]|uniref:SMP-30/gluconolactonase/LRE family protein n=1 Tax=Ensifer sp. ENS06 TaxID=2769276 RepID=UPI000DE028A0|nr:SMP-30/gluconolactonase/LRE family protein [Ensifer sp. ENS06]MBD9624704.1 SMP-30/gluconolactonase/LRE family protein [Ensifer sp. ENS06]
MTAVSSTWQICAQTHDRLGESILWHPKEQALYWIDYYGPFVHRQRHGVVETWKLDVGEIIGSLVFVHGQGLLIAMDHGLYFFDPGTGSTRFFADPKNGRRDVVYNDAKVDRAGRYWVGTLNLDEAEASSDFYSVFSNGQAETADGDFAICNGPAFSPDNRSLYFSDSARGRILRYDLDDRGVISNRRTFFTFRTDDGLPDGLAVDSAGNVWCALYGGAKVVCVDPAGRLRQSLPLPASYATSLCFGGPGLRTLFVTTGWNTREEAAANPSDKGGAVFMRDVKIPGLAEPIAFRR